MPVRIALLIALLATAAAVEVRIVSGADERLVKAASAAAERLRADGLVPIRMTLDDPALSATTLSSAALVISVGVDGYKRVTTLLPPDRLLVRCLDDGAEVAASHRLVTLGSPAAAQIDLLQRLLPKARIVGLLARTGSATAQARVKDWRESLPKGMELAVSPVDDPAAMATAIESLWQARVDVVTVESDPDTYSVPAIKAVLLGALRRKVPVIAFAAPVTRAGALASAEQTTEAQGRTAAILAGMLIADRAAAPRTLPTRPDICLNLAVAERLWVSIPADVRAEASQLFGMSGR